MMLLYGRRRIGKTYLLQRYFAAGVNGSGEGRPHCYFLAEQTTAAEQRAALAREILDALPAEGVAEAEIAVSWNSLLRFASQHASARPDGAGRFGLILDEFPYLVEQTPELPSIIQAWWDREGAHAPLFVVLCGSQLSAMAALGSESAPLFGRFNGGVFRLEALTYEDVAAFYSGSPRYGIPEVLTMYGVLGGTPRYHALADTSQPPESEIVTLLMQPRAILENEIRFLLSSEQIRDSAPYNAVLGAIAAGETQFGKILNRTGIERGSLSFYLKTLQGLGWVRRELPFGETSDRRALYRIADPFLSFWYRFVAPLSSSLQFSNPKDVFAERVAPLLGDYMGRYVFEEICTQWLRRHARERLSLAIKSLGRYWSRDGRVEIDIVAEMDDGRFLFCECKWRAGSAARLSDYATLRAKVAGLPDAKWREGASYALFAVGGFAPELERLASDRNERLFLVAGRDLLPGFGQ